MSTFRSGRIITLNHNVGVHNITPVHDHLLPRFDFIQVLEYLAVDIMMTIEHGVPNLPEQRRSGMPADRKFIRRFPLLVIITANPNFFRLCLDDGRIQLNRRDFKPGGDRWQEGRLGCWRGQCGA